MNFLVFAFAFCAFFLNYNYAVAEKMDLSKDHHESCGFWASIGECQKNPNYMLNYCAPSCKKAEEVVAENIPTSFYDIAETDIHGNTLHFSRFRGKVVYVVNVASYCGYTEENYNEFKSLQKYYDQGLEIVLAPCNSFGSQEPGDSKVIYNFATNKGFSGYILSKDEVNGKKTRESFRFLKHATGKSRITW
jgi:glutathione peroxidase